MFVHSRSNVNAVVCAQHFPNARRSQVAIVDTGLGFLGSFQETQLFRDAVRSCRHAITLGLAPFVTSKPRTGVPYETAYGRLGVGLFIVPDILDAVGGEILVVSGDAMARRRAGETRWRSVEPWQGAILGFEIPDDPRVSYDEALRNARVRARAIADARA